MSTEPTDSFELSLLDTANKVIDRAGTDLFLLRLDPAPLQQVSIEPVAELTVGGSG